MEMTNLTNMRAEYAEKLSGIIASINADVEQKVAAYKASLTAEAMNRDDVKSLQKILGMFDEIIAYEHNGVAVGVTSGVQSSTQTVDVAQFHQQATPRPGIQEIVTPTRK